MPRFGGGKAALAFLGLEIDVVLEANDHVNPRRDFFRIGVGCRYQLL